MRLAVISDPHAREKNLQEVLAGIGRQDPDALWCLGDLVGYGRDPAEVVSLVRQTTDYCLQGNHDAAAVGQFDDFLEALGGDWRGKLLREAEQVLPDDDFEWLASLKPFGVREGLACFHGSAADPLMGFLSMPEASSVARAQMEAQPGAISLVGHTHFPLAIRMIGDQVSWAEPTSETLDLSTGDRWILNPGSAGLRQFHRAGDRRPSWLLLDLDQGTAQWSRIGSP